MEASGRATPRAPPVRILVVEDDADALCGLVEVLQGVGGAAVDAAPGIATALVFLREHRYGLVLSDERLADGSGTDLLRWVREAQPAAARGLMTAAMDWPVLARAVNEARLHLVVAKPWDPEALVVQVRRLLAEEALLEERLRAFAAASAAGPGAEARPPVPGDARHWPPS